MESSDSYQGHVYGTNFSEHQEPHVLVVNLINRECNTEANITRVSEHLATYCDARQSKELPNVLPLYKKRESWSYRKTTGTPSRYKNVPVTKLRFICLNKTNVSHSCRKSFFLRGWFSTTTLCSFARSALAPPWVQLFWNTIAVGYQATTIILVIHYAYFWDIIYPFFLDSQPKHSTTFTTFWSQILEHLMYLVLHVSNH